MISAVLGLAILSGIAYMVYANGSDDTNSTTYPTWTFNEQYNHMTGPFCGRRGFGGRGGGGWGPSQSAKNTKTP